MGLRILTTYLKPMSLPPPTHPRMTEPQRTLGAASIFLHLLVWTLFPSVGVGGAARSAGGLLGRNSCERVGKGVIQGNPTPCPTQTVQSPCRSRGPGADLPFNVTCVDRKRASPSPRCAGYYHLGLDLGTASVSLPLMKLSYYEGG